MCQMLSAVISRQGNVKFGDNTMHHSEIGEGYDFEFHPKYWGGSHGRGMGYRSRKSVHLWCNTDYPPPEVSMHGKVIEVPIWLDENRLRTKDRHLDAEKVIDMPNATIKAGDRLVDMLMHTEDTVPSAAPNMPHIVIVRSGEHKIAHCDVVCAYGRGTVVYVKTCKAAFAYDGARIFMHHFVAPIVMSSRRAEFADGGVVWKPAMDDYESNYYAQTPYIPTTARAAPSSQQMQARIQSYWSAMMNAMMNAIPSKP